MDKTAIKKYIRELEPIPTPIKPKGIPTSPIRCILFDVYGTLFISDSGDIGMLESSPVKLAGLTDLINEFELPCTAEKLVHTFTDTIRYYHTKSKAEKRQNPEVEIISIWNAILADFENITPDRIKEFAIKFELTVNPVFPMPGLNDCLAFCRKNQIIMGIISNAQFYTPLLFNWFLDRNLIQLGFLPELTFLSYKFGYAKPSPDLFRKAVDQLEKQGIQQKNVIYLGNDMLNDILPSYQVGFQTALFAGDRRSLRLRDDNPRCRYLQPDIIVTDLAQIEDWF